MADIAWDLTSEKIRIEGERVFRGQIVPQFSLSKELFAKIVRAFLNCTNATLNILSRRFMKNR